MSPSRVTIAIPTYRRLDYLRLALASALSQTYPALEIVVSDNCSGDGTMNYLRSLRDPRLVVMEQESNLGMIGNWNKCLARASGAFFMLLSDDDLLRPTAIERLVAAITSAPQPEEVGFAYCRGLVIDGEGRAISLDPVAPASESARDFVLQFYRKRREIRPCATLLRTDDIRKIGGYSQGKVVLAVDAMVWSRVLQKRRTVVSVSEPLAEYRVHPTNTSVSGIHIWQNDLRLLAQLWKDDFRSAPATLQRKLRSTSRGHEAWMVAATINQGAKSWRDRLMLLKAYAVSRSSFRGVSGFRNLLGGLAKLFTPNFIKLPLRALLIRTAGPKSPALDAPSS